MGYVRGFVHGAVAGTLIGLWVAPQSGERTRAQLRAFGKAARDGIDTAQRTAREQLERRRHREEAEMAFRAAPQNGHR